MAAIPEVRSTPDKPMAHPTNSVATAGTTPTSSGTQHKPASRPGQDGSDSHVCRAPTADGHGRSKPCPGHGPDCEGDGGRCRCQEQPQTWPSDGRRRSQVSTKRRRLVAIGSSRGHYLFTDLIDRILDRVSISPSWWVRKPKDESVSIRGSSIGS